MSTAKLDTSHNREVWSWPLAPTLVRHIAPPQPQLRCPDCGSILYTRRNKLCAVCGQELPPAVRFSDEEATRVGAILQAEREKHRAWMNRG